LTFRPYPKYSGAHTEESMAHTGKTFVSNSVGHFDVAGPDLMAIGRFYTSVFDWKLDSRGPGYTLLQTPTGTVGGALVESEEASLILGVVVPRLSEALEKAIRAGGTILMPATDNGWVKKAQVRDPAGNVLTLIEGG
jgi:predicted enzyme related to lactoylglutathione lyase